MKTSPKLILALLAVASCGAGAETYSAQTSQERRDRNREEALTQYRAGNTTTARQAGPDTTARQAGHDVAQSTRRGAHRVAETGRSVGHKTAVQSRKVGHAVAVKARDTTARADAKFGKVNKKDGTGEASNPTGQKNTAANGPKP